MHKRHTLILALRSSNSRIVSPAGRLGRSGLIGVTGVLTGSGALVGSFLPCSFCVVGFCATPESDIPLAAATILLFLCRAFTALIPLTLTDSLLIGVGFAVGTVGEGTFWSTGVLEPALDAPDAGRGIPAGGGDTPNVCPGCPPICDARRPAILGFTATSCAGPIEPGRGGALVRIGCAGLGAEGRMAEAAVEEVGVAVLEGLPEGGWGVDEGVPYVYPLPVSLCVTMVIILGRHPSNCHRKPSSKFR